MRALPYRLAAAVSLGMLAMPGGATAAAPPLLGQTPLYTRLAHDCRTVDLAHWTHPTRQVLARHGVTLDKLQLCNDDRYPIYTVRFKFDPQGQTTDYFHPLYAKMAKANGYWPFSFVDTTDDLIVDVRPDRRGNVDVDYEQFGPPGPAGADPGGKS